MKFSYRKPSIKKRISARTSVKKAIRTKTRVPRGYGYLTNPKKTLYNKVYNRTTKKACYVATAVYDDVDAWQVVKLRKYRDTVLRKHLLGRLFIYSYYLVSPKLVGMFKHVRPINKLMRKLLDYFVKRLD